MKLSAASGRCVRQAHSIARSMGHSFVGSIHLLLALCRSQTCIHGLLTGLGWDAVLGDSLCRLTYGQGDPRLPLPQGLSRNARRILRQAGCEAAMAGSPAVEPIHLLLALGRVEDTGAAQLLSAFDIPAHRVFSAGAEQLRQGSAIHTGRKKEVFTTKLLEQFSEDMLAKAAAMDPVIGRDREIDMVIGILCRKQKNNPALVGEPGVGKTAIAEGLAQRMAAGNVPVQLKDKRLVSLNMASLVAGTKYRGEFEERIREVLAEIRRSPEIILFIDEMHTIVGAGAAEGAIDAANIFKPALGRGEVQMLGATTREEYRKFIEKDAALERRFRPVAVEEPSEEVTMQILRSVRPGLEKHHRLRLTDEALQEAVRLSVRYLPEKYLPDKAIDLLDEGAARVSMGSLAHIRGCAERKELEEELNEAVRERRYERAAELRDRVQKLMERGSDRPHPRAVTGQDIAWVVCARTGIPVGKLSSAERERLLQLERLLSAHVVGQGRAVHAAAEAVRRGSSGIRDGSRPVACLLFTGPTGVGKTELCRAMAEEIYGSRKAMIRLDMTEYMEKASVSRLIGAPPGYVGFEEGGKLTEAVRRRPYSLVLLDEVEKAHPEVLGLLLQIMEEGELTDSTGRHVSFRNAIVVLTSNVGGGVKGESLGFLGSDREKQVSDALRTAFTPEFLGRLDAVIPFEPLGAAEMEHIVRKYLDQLRTRTESLGIQLVLPQELAASISRRCTGSDGARQLRRMVQNEVEGKLSAFLLGFGRKPARVRGMLEEGQLIFHS